jgi:hypothetical protein
MSNSQVVANHNYKIVYINFNLISLIKLIKLIDHNP